MGRVMSTLASRFAAGRLMISVMGALVAFVALLPGGGEVEASCGDWLAGHHRSAEAPEGLAAEREAVGPVASLPADAPRLPQCHGPACRGVPFLPTLPRDVSFDAPRYDPADRGGMALLFHRDVGRPFRAGNDGKPLSVIAPVPIRPPRRAALEA
jgi:hypothetical protein